MFGGERSSFFTFLAHFTAKTAFFAVSVKEL